MRNPEQTLSACIDCHDRPVLTALALHYHNNKLSLYYANSETKEMLTTFRQQFFLSARPLRVLRSSRPEPNFISPRRPRLPAPLHKPSFPPHCAAEPLQCRSRVATRGLLLNVAVAARHSELRAADPSLCWLPVVGPAKKSDHKISRSPSVMLTGST